MVHIWFLKSLPSRIGALLDMPLKDIEKVLYFESYIVIDPGETPLQYRELLTEARYRKAMEEHGGKFVAEMGAEAVRKLLKELIYQSFLKTCARKCVMRIRKCGVRKWPSG